MISYDYYRMFYFVAECKSFTKAAELLHNNQPNITRCMNILENELECQLLIRSNRGVSLTPEGERLFAHVREAYKHLTDGELEIRKDTSLDSGHISIGASEIALHLFLLDKLESFHTEFPNVRLRIHNYSSPQALKALENGSVDFAVVTSPIDLRKNLTAFPLYSFRDTLIGGLKYKELADCSRRLRELVDYPFVCLGANTSSNTLYTQFFMEHGLTFKPDMEASTTDQILPMIMHNLGIGFYPKEMASYSISTGVVLPIPLTETLPERQVYLVVDESKPQSIAVRKIIEELYETSSQSI